MRRRHDKAARDLAQRHRCCTVGGCSKRRCDARDDLVRNAGFTQRRDFLARAPEDHRIARFQPRNLLALLGQPHDQRVDLRLAEGMMPLRLADLDALGVAPSHLHHELGHQLVVNDHVRFLQQPLCPKRQQVLGAGARPDQPDHPFACAPGLHVEQARCFLPGARHAEIERAIDARIRHQRLIEPPRGRRRS